MFRLGVEQKEAKVLVPRAAQSPVIALRVRLGVAESYSPVEGSRFLRLGPRADGITQTVGVERNPA